MPRFLEALESRTLLSAVTTATLAADNAAIIAAGANGTAAVKPLAADVKSGLSAITADLKTLPKTNAPLLVTLKADVARFKATVSTDLSLLIKPGEALSKKSTATGQSLFTKATPKSVAVAAAEITALGTVTTTPLANLLTAFRGNNIQADFQALVTANPTATQLSTDVNTTLTNASTQVTAIQTNANQFTTDIATLASDLTAVKTTYGSPPNLVGTLTGNSRETKGKVVGSTATLTAVVTSEDASGNIAGTFTADDSSGDTNQYSLAGTITLSGAFSATLTPTNSGNHSAKITGQFKNGTLNGTYSSSDSSGVFTVTLV